MREDAFAVLFCVFASFFASEDNSEVFFMQRKTDIKKLTAAAMLCALAYVAMAVGRIPVVLFLSYDPKDIIIALGGLIWGPWMSFAVSCVVSFIEMITVSDTGLIGFAMNILSTCSFACTAAVIYKKKRTLSGAVIGLLVGSFAMVAVMLLWNYLITPLYMGVTREAVVDLLLPAFLPFNLLKAGLNAGFTFLLYRPVVSALRKAGYVASSKEGIKKKTPYGLFILSALLIITCVLFILSMQNII